MQKATLLTGLLILLASPLSAQKAKPLPNDLKWMTQSIEYAAVCVQTYRAAWRAVKASAAKESRNWVVVLDVDETVLDNSPYALERTALDSGFTMASWAKWVLRKEAGLVPGAKAFIDSVRTLGPKAHIAYITNRRYEREAATIENLQKYGLFQEDDIMLTRKGPEDTKEKRRECLRRGTGRCSKHGPLVILALIGDNIRDFFEVYGMEKARIYREQLLPKDKNWGTRFFMIPNPNYGSWQRDYR